MKQTTTAITTTTATTTTATTNRKHPNRIGRAKYVYRLEAHTAEMYKNRYVMPILYSLIHCAKVSVYVFESLACFIKPLDVRRSDQPS